MRRAASVGVVELLVRPGSAKREDGAAVVGPGRIAPEDGMADHTELLLRHAEALERRATALAVDDDAFEAAEQSAPEVELLRGATRQQIVCGEDERRGVPEQANVDLGRRQPLHMDDVRRRRPQAHQPDRMLDRLQRQPQPRVAETRRERVEELASRVSLRFRGGAEPESRRDQVDVGADPSQGGGELVVVRRRVRRRVGDDDAHARRLMSVLIRSWNVFHGNAYPTDHRSYLAAMIRLAVADRPDILCLQEVPLWALSRLERWSGMTARSVMTRRAVLSVRLAGLITRLHNGFFRSGLTGQANVILVARGLEPREHRSLRIDAGRDEQRHCHAVRLDRLVVANLHATNDFARPRIPAAEIVRGEAFVSELAGPLPAVLAGDFNLRAEHLDELEGWSARGPGIDHVLVRGLAASPLLVWPRERRIQNGVVLSDHAPVEARIG